MAAWSAAGSIWLEALDDLYSDAWHVFAGARRPPQSTAIVAIDDETLLALRDDPIAFWGPYFASAIDVLDHVGVKAVGLDVLYQVSAEAWLDKLQIPQSEHSRTYDAPLRQALSRGKVVLITQLVPHADGAALILPPRDQLVVLPHGINDLGIANLVPDSDKHVRRFRPFFDKDPQKPATSFAVQLALRAAGEDPAKAAWQLAGQDLRRELEPLPIRFSGPPGTVPSVSMSALLKPGASQDPAVQALHGRVVIIAPTSPALSDLHFTPYSRGPRATQMAGGEVHANIVETILSGDYPRVLGPAAGLAYAAALALLASVAFLRLRLGWTIAAAALLLVAPAVAAWFAFLAGWIFPVAASQLAIVAALLAALALRFTGEERERARIRDVFGRYVSDEIVKKLLAEDRRVDLAGETMSVTVLFIDIRGFTTLSEKLPAHEVVEMLNEYFSRVCACIFEQGGTVDKFIGDAVMAIFGSPVPQPDHARRALRAALAMAREAEGFREWMRQRFAGRGIADFAVGIGLCTGQAVIGDIGSTRRKEFTAIGDTVNTASRLEGATKDLHCTIAASRSTVDAAGAGVRTGKLQVVAVKGRLQPVEVYEILGLD